MEVLFIYFHHESLGMGGKKKHRKLKLTRRDNKETTIIQSFEMKR